MFFQTETKKMKESSIKPISSFCFAQLNMARLCGRIIKSSLSNKMYVNSLWILNNNLHFFPLHFTVEVLSIVLAQSRY